MHKSHLDARASQVHVGLPLGLHAAVLGGLGVASLMGAGHRVSRRQRQDAGDETHDGAYRPLTSGSGAGQQIGPGTDHTWTETSYGAELKLNQLTGTGSDVITSWPGRLWVQSGPSPTG